MTEDQYPLKPTKFNDSSKSFAGEKPLIECPRCHSSMINACRIPCPTCGYTMECN